MTRIGVFKVLNVVIFTFLLSGMTLAQTDVDVLRYSDHNLNGSARNIGLGNTMGSIGGDISAISNNPAGIGRYTTTEFTISPGFGIADVNSRYLSNTFNERDLTGVFSGFGIALAKGNNDSRQDWKGPNFAFGLNNKTIFNQTIFFDSYNSSSSLLETFAERLQGLSDEQAQSFYPFDASLAYLGNLIYEGNNGNYDPLITGEQQARGLITRKGNIKELGFGAAGNYKGILLVGASIGIPIINYEESKMYSESDVRDSSFFFNSFSISEQLRTDGFGINGKFGVIASVHPMVRLSAAFHTPTFYQMDDAFRTLFISDYDFFSNDTLFTAEIELTSPDGISEYTMVTPWKATFGSSFILKTRGLIAIEYGVSKMNSASIRYKNISSAEQAFEDGVNRNIDDKYGLQHQLKVGMEFNIEPFYVRGGFQYQSSPFADQSNTVGNMTRYIYSGGLGVRIKKFVFDAAYQYLKQNSLYFPYTLNAKAVEPVSINQNNTLVVFTLGYKM